MHRLGGGAGRVADSGREVKEGWGRREDDSRPFGSPCMRLTSAGWDAWSIVATEPDVLGSMASKERAMFS